MNMALKILALLTLPLHVVYAQMASPAGNTQTNASASTTSTNAATSSQQTQSAALQSQGLAWREYGLTETDWQRYQSILASPQAYWSEDKRPLILLGVTARNEAERSRYAELYIDFEYKAAAGLMTFKSAVDIIGKRKHGTEALFSAALTTVAAQAEPMFGVGDRMMLVIDPTLDCLPCTQAIATVQQIGRQNASTGIDVYFVNATREQIVAYGSQRLILPEDVSGKRITLNVATPEFLTQMQLTTNAVPAAFRRRGQTLTKIPIGELLNLRMPSVL